jgi:hypothetical protein
VRVSGSGSNARYCSPFLQPRLVFLSLCLSRDLCVQVMLFKPEVRPGRQPAPKVDPLFGHGDPDALATPAADEQQKPMSPKEKKESARKKKEQVAHGAPTVLNPL